MPRELMIFLSLVGLGAVWVSLPLLPAILIYRLFPSTQVAVAGPLASLTVRASGAFAAYMVVFMAIYPLVHTTTGTMGSFEHHFWTVNGRVKLVAESGQEMLAEALLRKMEIHPDPDPLRVASYMLRLKVIEDSDGDLPVLTIDVPGFGTSLIDLRSGSKGIIVDKLRRAISITEPIEIREAGQGSRALFLPDVHAVDETSSSSDVPSARSKSR
jgi:hypothetical protein